MLQPYIKRWQIISRESHSATALSDYYYDEESARISRFCQSAEMDFQHLVGPRNVSVDLKYDVLCL